MDDNKLELAKRLKEEIKELDAFLFVIAPELSRYGRGVGDISCKVKRVNFFAKRFFGCGSHKKEIILNDSCIRSLSEIVHTRKINLQKEYDEL